MSLLLLYVVTAIALRAGHALEAGAASDFRGAPPSEIKLSGLVSAFSGAAGILQSFSSFARVAGAAGAGVSAGVWFDSPK